MTNSTKAREWWIDLQYKYVAEPGETRAWSGVHVIEYSAFEQAQAEIERLRAELEKEQESVRFYRREWESACERLDYAKEEIERLKETISHLPKVPTQSYEKEMAQEIARLRDQVDTLSYHGPSDYAEMKKERDQFKSELAQATRGSTIDANEFKVSDEHIENVRLKAERDRMENHWRETAIDNKALGDKVERLESKLIKALEWIDMSPVKDTPEFKKARAALDLKEE